MPNVSIYTGLWINWSKGAFNGATLTLPTKYGNLLIAFLALFVSWSGNYLWDSLCYAIHQYRATPENREGLHHQQQVVLRSGLSNPSALWLFMKICWLWRSRVTNPFLKSILLILVSALFLVLLILAGIFSSQLTTTTNEVLLISTECGWVTEQGYQHLVNLSPDDLAPADALFVSANSYFRRSLEYSESCYSSLTSVTSTLCDAFVVPHITSSIDRNASCPFKASTCRNTAIKFDSGLIEANRHLGINVRPEAALSLRKVTTCAPVQGEGVYDSGWTTTQPDNWLMPPTNRVSFGSNRTAVYQDKEFRYYHFGPTFSFGRPLSNATFMIGKQWMDQQNREYILAAVTAFLGNNSNCNGCDFIPIDDFSRKDADVSLLGLINLATYTGPVIDPWFQPTSEPSEQNGNTIGWYTTTNMSFVGCTEQYQVCTHDRCSPLTGLYALNHAKDTFGLTEAQSATFDWLWKGIWGTNMEYLIVFLGADVLRAQDNLYRIGFMSSALDANHWQVEMENIHNVSMAFLQKRFVDFANPPNLEVRPNVTIRQYLQDPGELRRFCTLMKIRSSEHSCFSIFKLAVVLIAGSIIMLLSPALPSIISKFQHRTARGRYRRTTWIETDILPLHRRYLEAQGIGLWESRGRRSPRNSRAREVVFASIV